MEGAIISLICILFPCFILDYTALKDAQQQGIIAKPGDNAFVNFFKSGFWIGFFEIAKIFTTGAIFLVAYALTVIVRGPRERYSYSGGDGFLGGTSTGVYMNDTFGIVFMLLAPTALLILAAWVMARVWKLHGGLFISLFVYFLPAYIAYLWIMIWEW
jgi:hypothetical protein